MKKIKKIFRKLVAEKIITKIPTPFLFFPVNGTFMIEPSNYCNLKCPLCPTSTAMSRKRENLSYDDFVRIVDEVLPYAKRLALFNFGEPFINKDLFKMISYVESKGIYVLTSTNSTIWTEEIYSQIFKSQLSEIIVCLDGISKATHEDYRRGSDFDKTVNSIKRLCEVKKKQKSKKPLITLQFVVMKNNEKEIDDLLPFAKSLGVDRLSLKSVSLGSWVDNIQRGLNASAFLPEDSKYRRYHVHGSDILVKRDISVCSWVIRNGVVLANGDLTICCYDYDGKYKIGNVFQDGYLNLLKSKRFKEVRRSMIKKKYPICQQCQHGSIDFAPIYFEEKQ